MNMLLTIIGSYGLWVLFDWYRQTPQSAVIGTVILIVAGAVAVFVFRFLFDLLFPDPPCSSFGHVGGEDDEW